MSYLATFLKFFGFIRIFHLFLVLLIFLIFRVQETHSSCLKRFLYSLFFPSEQHFIWGKQSHVTRISFELPLDPLSICAIWTKNSYYTNLEKFSMTFQVFWETISKLIESKFLYFFGLALIFPCMFTEIWRQYQKSNLCLFSSM